MSGDFAAFDTSLGADDPDRLVAVPAAELDEWAWLAGRLADWLHEASEATAGDFAHHFGASPTPDGAVTFLDHITERIGGLLLDADRGQP